MPPTPETPWLLTVYSPSAWHPLQSKGVANVIDGWTDGDLLAVLPDDLPATWRTWFSSVPLRALALAKYDLWPNLLAACQAHDIPVHAFAAAPSSTAPNPKPSTPTLWKLVTTISVQDEASAASFARIGLTDNVTVDGDPRVERVLSRSTSLDPAWQAWAANASQVVVAGSTWTEEEQALRTLDWHPQRRLVLVPHDVSTAHLTALDRLWEGGAIRASQWLDLDVESRERWSVVIVDRTGLLFDLYRIGTVAVVGGGHGSGLHNVLEPASAGLPIVTGPELGAFREAHARTRWRLVFWRRGGLDPWMARRRGQLPSVWRGRPHVVGAAARRLRTNCVAVDRIALLERPTFATHNVFARMVELVDTTDLNSVDPNGSCGFKSRSGYRTGEF